MFSIGDTVEVSTENIYQHYVRWASINNLTGFKSGHFGSLLGPDPIVEGVIVTKGSHLAQPDIMLVGIRLPDGIEIIAEESDLTAVAKEEPTEPAEPPKEFRLVVRTPLERFDSDWDEYTADELASLKKVVEMASTGKLNRLVVTYNSNETSIPVAVLANSTFSIETR